MGFGGYGLFVSDDFEDLPLVGALLDDEFGLEAFYNFAITPALQFSVDVQWIDPGVELTDDTVVVGTRLFFRL
jgi:hypothetical protein